MNLKTHLVLAVTALFAFSACSDSSSTAAGSGTFTVNSVTGTYVMDGTWKTACYNIGATNIIETRVVSGATLTGTTASYAGADTTCAGTATDLPGEKIVVTASNGGSQSAIWSDNTITGTTVTPTVLGGAVPILDTTIGTLHVITGTFGGADIGTGADTLDFVDDSTATITWYRSTNQPPGVCDVLPDATEMDDECLFTGDVFVKQ